MITGILILFTKVLDKFRRSHRAGSAQQIPENLNVLNMFCMFSVYQFNITILRKTLLTHEQRNGPNNSNLQWFWKFFCLFLFDYFSLNYYFSNIRSDFGGDMLLVI